jgi:diguanylate cyclase (GGDEF)-like protein/PAS domain S-box-containing protein
VARPSLIANLGGIDRVAPDERAEWEAVRADATQTTLRQQVSATGPAILSFLLLGLMEGHRVIPGRMLWWTVAATTIQLVIGTTSWLAMRGHVAWHTATIRRLHAGGLLLGSLLWGLAPLLFRPHATGLERWLILIVLVTASTSSSCVIAAGAPWSFLAYNMPVWILISIQLIADGSAGTIPLGIGCLAFCPSLVVFNLEAHRTLTEALRLKHRNTALVDQLQTAEARATSIVETAAEAIFTVRADGTIEGANRAAERILHADDADLVGRPLWAFLPELFTDGRCAVVSGRESTLTTDDFDSHEVLVSTSKVDNSDLYTVIARDISERKELEAQLEHQATHDHLTGLLNRASLLVRAERAAHAARRSGSGYALMFIDLDRFKQVNDVLGHRAGDDLLREVANRLAASVRAVDTVARLGGDEFVILMEDVNDAFDAHRMAERIREGLEVTVDLGGGDVVNSSASVGLAFAVQGADDPQALLDAADAAMYRAKQTGRRKVVLFDEAMQKWVDDRTEIEGALRRAITDGELRVHAQPVVQAVTHEVVAVELLARWYRPGHGIVPPGSFIHVAEESGLIVDIGRWVMGEAGALLARWRDDPRLAHMRVSVNVSGLHFTNGDLVRDVSEALEATGAPAEKLWLELTETYLAGDLDGTRTTLNRLREVGVGIALDDFGTGYSSLAYLASLPASVIKIDRSFVIDVATDVRPQAVIRAVCDLARTFERTVVVEGVETIEQLHAVEALGCDLVQGFLFSRPLPIEEFEATFSAVAPARPAS